MTNNKIIQYPASRYNRVLADPKYAKLSKKEEARLMLSPFKNGETAEDRANQLVKHNLKFALHTARQIMGIWGLDEEDITQAGLLGAIINSRKFDSRIKIKFISYAVDRIKQACYEEVAFIKWQKTAVFWEHVRINNFLADLTRHTRKYYSFADVLTLIRAMKEQSLSESALLDCIPVRNSKVLQILLDTRMFKKNDQEEEYTLQERFAPCYIEKIAQNPVVRQHNIDLLAVYKTITNRYTTTHAQYLADWTGITLKQALPLARIASLVTTIRLNDIEQSSIYEPVDLEEEKQTQDYRWSSLGNYFEEKDSDAAFCNDILDELYGEDDRIINKNDPNKDSVDIEELTDADLPLPSEYPETREFAEIVDRFFTNYSSRTSAVIHLYFGLTVPAALTLDQMGTFLHLTRERVRLIKDKQLLRMKNGLSGMDTSLLELVTKKSVDKPAIKFRNPLEDYLHQRWVEEARPDRAAEYAHRYGIDWDSISSIQEPGSLEPAEVYANLQELADLVIESITI